MRHRVPAALLLGAIFFWLGKGASAATLDLASIIANPSFDAALVPVDWTATQPNTSYPSAVPVNPVINPVDPTLNDGTTLPALTAQFGPNFVGVRNPPLTEDLKGKLVSNAIATSIAADAVLQLHVYGNRGRLDTNGNLNGEFPSAASAPRLRVQFWGFGAGALPTVNDSDDWTRSEASKITQTFDFSTTAPGEWAQETFSFAPGVALDYVAVALIGQNLNHDQYVAIDVGVVPEPATGLLVGLGLVFLSRRKRC